MKANVINEMGKIVKFYNELEDPQWYGDFGDIKNVRLVDSYVNKEGCRIPHPFDVEKGFGTRIEECNRCKINVGDYVEVVMFNRPGKLQKFEIVGLLVFESIYESEKGYVFESETDTERGYGVIEYCKLIVDSGLVDDNGCNRLSLIREWDDALMWMADDPDGRTVGRWNERIIKKI